MNRAKGYTAPYTYSTKNTRLMLLVWVSIIIYLPFSDNSSKIEKKFSENIIIANIKNENIRLLIVNQMQAKNMRYT